MAKGIQDVNFRDCYKLKEEAAPVVTCLQVFLIVVKPLPSTWIRWLAISWVGGETLCKVEELKHGGVLFTREIKMDERSTDGLVWRLQ